MRVGRAKSKVGAPISRSHVRGAERTLARLVPTPGSVSMIDLGISFVRRSFRRGKGTKRSAAEPAGTGSLYRVLKPIRFSLSLSLRSSLFFRERVYARGIRKRLRLSSRGLPKISYQKSRTRKIALRNRFAEIQLPPRW